ncbi:MAG: hypothetical protein ABIT37_01635 [Luteolibacter sp.]
MSSVVSLVTASLETTNTKLAGCLSSCGIKLRKGNEFMQLMGDRGEQTCWFFEEKSPCGQYDTSALIAAWDDKEWHEKNPEHPFAYMKVAFDNAERLTDFARRSIPTVAVAKGKKVAYLSLNASDSLQKEIFTKLNKR